MSLSKRLFLYVMDAYTLSQQPEIVPEGSSIAGQMQFRSSDF